MPKKSNGHTKGSGKSSEQVDSLSQNAAADIDAAEEEIRADVVVKYPPEEFQYDPAKGIVESICSYAPTMLVHVAEVAKSNSPEDKIAAMGIVWKGRRARDGDALAALESFLLAHEHRVYPPRDILDWLAKALGHFHAEAGVQKNKKGELEAIDLGKSLGLVPTQGKTPLFKKALMGERDELVALDVARLRGWFGLSIEEAANMAAARLAEADYNKHSKFDIDDIDAATVVTRYKQMKLTATEQHYRDTSAKVSALEKEAYWNVFPQHSWPPKKKKKSSS